jgi:hypothetical protein
VALANALSSEEISKRKDITLYRKPGLKQNT